MNEHNLENTNNDNSCQVLEPDIDLQMTSYDEKIQRIKQEHRIELYIYYKTNTLMMCKCSSCNCRI